MNDMYSSGLPYSDEIYHHGIPGQKWGVRRFQNPDGSLTSEGRKRYSKGGGESKTIKSGSHKTGKDFVKGAAAVGMKAASRLGEGVARGVKTKLAEKMPFMLNDEELEKYRDRLRRENTFRNEMATRRELKRRSQGDQFAKKLVQDVASNTIKTVANKAVNKLADEAFKTSSDRLREQLDLEAKELKNEQEREKASRARISEEMNNDIHDMNEANEARKDVEEKQKETLDKRDQTFNKMIDLFNQRASTSSFDEQKKINKKINALGKEFKKYNKQYNKYSDDINEYNKLITRRNQSLTYKRDKVNDMNQKNSNQINIDQLVQDILDKIDEQNQQNP